MNAQVEVFLLPGDDQNWSVGIGPGRRAPVRWHVGEVTFHWIGGDNNQERAVWMLRAAADAIEAAGVEP